MYIKDLYAQKKPVISLEIFPPKKTAAVETLYGTMGALSELAPDFVSVTCGAGGSGAAAENTRKIAQTLSERFGQRSLAHMTCISSGRQGIAEAVRMLRDAGIVNILALRGDPPAGGTAPAGDYQYAAQLIRDLSAQGGLCIGAACYPEGHIECASWQEDLRHLREKQDAGASFLITQLFFENSLFYRFYDRARSAGIVLPISAGVMPILSRDQIQRMVFMCGASLPSALVRLLYKYEHSPADLRRAGIEYALAQMDDLVAQGVDGVHIYTMNQPDIAAAAFAHLRGDVAL